MARAADVYTHPPAGVETNATELLVQSESHTEAVGQPVVAMQGVGKRLNGIYALRNISMNIRRGEVFGLLGPSGAGKSTLVKLVMGFLQPDEGAISLFGQSGQYDRAQARNRIGYLPERPHYHGNFRGQDYLRFHARLSGLTTRNARVAVERAIEATGLATLANRRIKTYEPEILQRFGLAVALVGAGGDYTELLVLDEPSDNLSRGGQIIVRDIILDCNKRGTTVLLASHRITEVERACTWVGILRGGRLYAQTNVENSPRTIIVAVPRDGASSIEMLPRLLAHLKNLHPFVTTTGGGTEAGPLVVSLPSGPHILNAAGVKASAIRALVDVGWDIISVYVERKDLESIYLQTAPPKPQDEGGVATGPLGTLTGNTNTGTLTTLGQEVGRRVTRPLYASEVGRLNGEAEPSNNNGRVPGQEPIAGRAVRREER